MKFFLISALALASHNSYASVSPDRFLKCTFTTNSFGADPEITKVFKFIEIAGYLPAAGGSFKIDSENVEVKVISEVIFSHEENTEFVNTSMTLISNSTTIGTGFSNKIDEQLSYLEVNKSGVVLCVAI